MEFSIGILQIADPRGGPGAASPAPVKTSEKKMAAVPQVSRVIGPPRTNFWIRYCTRNICDIPKLKILNIHFIIAVCTPLCDHFGVKQEI